ncbi:hypothetical protein QWZ16_18940 [Vibrio ostreicida]|uniref:Uncharacterized protein n=1 Tax=Vibrio ostreicida TaxID=526588 RepID=A0ABT8BYB4_9VIBR|nr:hypothetical protein [Vibrio ostreicida]MDN3611679.1 hypothetical protein [Vibrio ostreicida]
MEWIKISPPEPWQCLHYRLERFSLTDETIQRDQKLTMITL